ncbi:nickel pincer cofactor biosynthesis protein LarC [Kineococcus siccus]|uniref:nickel pincer cofactor biosynthesis protein LarC n=1 Tax=Kineococcus siccus TaxID=2696567 RepID=UPI00196A9A56
MTHRDVSPATRRLAWIDAGAGVAGDMLLGALIDAGADLGRVRAAVDAVVSGAVALRTSTVTRAGLRALKLDVDVLEADSPHRHWSGLRDRLVAADLDAGVRERALAVFARLAEAEGRVHGIPAEDVHFHEVGSLDSIADVVGVCAALVDLGVEELLASPVAVGSGTVRAAHGTLPVPPPAVVELSRGWEVFAGGTGELATPTGMALVTTLAHGPVPLPRLVVEGSGAGAGTRDPAERANVVRVVVGRSVEGEVHEAVPGQDAVLLAATVDDLDPRVWPEVLRELLSAGALDAWLTPVLMKKGRPGHVLEVLAAPGCADALSAVVLRHTSTLGVRRSPVTRDVLDRAHRAVEVDGHAVRVKVGHRAGVVVQAMPEFEDVLVLARARGCAVQDALLVAHAAAVGAGLVPGAPWV